MAGRFDEHGKRHLTADSERSGQTLAIRYTEWLAEAGIESSMGSRGDSYDNALAETVIGLYKTEVIHHDGLWCGLEQAEYATLEWAAWFNSQRLLEPIGYVFPVENEERFHRTQASQLVADALK